MVNEFVLLSQEQVVDCINGGITLQNFELITLGVATTAGILVSSFCPPVGLALITGGWAICAQAEEYGMEHAK